MPGESPPPPPRVCLGRDELIERIVDLAERLIPVALIGAGGIGKTSIALTLLHDDRIKQRFGENRWFIRCDQFPTSRTNFLRRLSEATGAGIENPEELTPLRPFLSSKQMLIILDNAESALDPRGTDAQEIYAVVEELSQFNNVWLCITSRISTVPPECETLGIPTLPVEAALDAFYRIYNRGERSDRINNILERLDFHPLSITLLATVAHHSIWDTNRLAKEWEQQRTGVLHTQHNKSLAATIELSLASPMFQEFGPDAQELLGVVAFFPQGVNENNLDWLFPSIPNRGDIFDKFCILSLTYRNNGSITMLAPLRDYLCLKHPTSSPLLRAIKKRYFRRLAVDVHPDRPGFEEARWIASEDVNVEHLLGAFMSVDANSEGVWDVCACFMDHLYWHKPRLVLLGPKIEGLSDDHPSKPHCLFELSRLFNSVGNCAESKRLLNHALKLWREQRDDFQVAQTLRFLANTNRMLDLHEEGISQAKEALEICERLNDTAGQARSLGYLAWLLWRDNQLVVAEEAASRAIGLLLDNGDQFMVCQCHRVLGYICHSKGETENAIDHFGTALGIASSFNWDDQRFWNHYSLAKLFSDEDRFDDAHAQVERSKLFATNDAYYLGRAVELQARLWYKQRMLEEAKSAAEYTASVYEKLGAAWDLETCQRLLRQIEETS